MKLKAWERVLLMVAILEVAILVSRAHAGTIWDPINIFWWFR